MLDPGDAAADDDRPLISGSMAKTVSSVMSSPMNSG